jgi:hypothetical protein
MKLLVLAAFCGVAFAQSYTTVKDTLSAGEQGAATNGSITITWPQFRYGTATIAQSPSGGYNTPIVAGRVNVSLVPTDRSGGATYRVVTTIGSQAWVSYWAIPTLPSVACASASYCTIAEVTVSTTTGSLTWSTLTNAQWTTLTNSQWTTLAN